MRHRIELKVNGEIYEVEIEPNRTLLEVLRENIGLTGTKTSCNTGECGACTVIIDGKSALSCLTLAVDVQGREIITIEGLSRDGKLHPIQESFMKYGAFQCGFCTPGIIMAVKSLLDENPAPTREEIKDAIANNLCRCSSYTRIIKAIEAISK